LEEGVGDAGDAQGLPTPECRQDLRGILLATTKGVGAHAESVGNLGLGEADGGELLYVVRVNRDARTGHGPFGRQSSGSFVD
jgi:hypothetical protein